MSLNCYHGKNTKEEVLCEIYQTVAFANRENFRIVILEISKHDFELIRDAIDLIIDDRFLLPTAYGRVEIKVIL
jgi:hypothetical protein